MQKFFGFFIIFFIIKEYSTKINRDDILLSIHQRKFNDAAVGAAHPGIPQEWFVNDTQLIDQPLNPESRAKLDLVPLTTTEADADDSEEEGSAASNETEEKSVENIDSENKTLEDRWNILGPSGIIGAPLRHLWQYQWSPHRSHKGKWGRLWQHHWKPHESQGKPKWGSRVWFCGRRLTHRPSMFDFELHEWDWGGEKPGHESRKLPFDPYGEYDVNTEEIPHTSNHTTDAPSEPDQEVTEEIPSTSYVSFHKLKRYFSRGCRNIKMGLDKVFTNLGLNFNPKKQESVIYFVPDKLKQHLQRHGCKKLNRLSIDVREPWIIRKRRRWLFHPDLLYVLAPAPSHGIEWGAGPPLTEVYTHNQAQINFNFKWTPTGHFGRTRNELIPPGGIQMWNLPNGQLSWFIPLYLLQGMPPGSVAGGWCVPEYYIRQWAIIGPQGWHIPLDTLKRWTMRGCAAGYYVPAQMIIKFRINIAIPTFQVPFTMYRELQRVERPVVILPPQRSSSIMILYPVIQGIWSPFGEIIPPFGVQRWILPDRSQGWLIPLCIIDSVHFNMNYNGWYIPQPKLLPLIKNNGLGGWFISTEPIIKWILEGNPNGFYVPYDRLLPFGIVRSTATWVVPQQFLVVLQNVPPPSLDIIIQIYRPRSIYGGDATAPESPKRNNTASDIILGGSATEIIPPDGIQIWSMPYGVLGWYIPFKILDPSTTQDNKDGWYIPITIILGWIKNETRGRVIPIDTIYQWILRGAKDGMYIPTQMFEVWRIPLTVKKWIITDEVLNELRKTIPGLVIPENPQKGEVGIYLEGSYGKTTYDILLPDGCEKWYMPQGGVGWYIPIIQIFSNTINNDGWYIPEMYIRSWIEKNGDNRWRLPITLIIDWIQLGSELGLYVPGYLLAELKAPGDLHEHRIPLRFIIILLRIPKPYCRLDGLISKPVCGMNECARIYGSWTVTQETVPPTSIQVWETPGRVIGWYIPCYILQEYLPTKNLDGWFIPYVYIQQWVQKKDTTHWFIPLRSIVEWISKGSKNGLFVQGQSIIRWNLDLNAKVCQISPEAYNSMSRVPKPHTITGYALYNLDGDPLSHIYNRETDVDDDQNFNPSPSDSEAVLGIIIEDLGEYNELVPPDHTQKWYMPDGTVGWFVSLILLQLYGQPSAMSGWYIPEMYIKLWARYNGAGGVIIPISVIQQWIEAGAKNGLYIAEEAYKKAEINIEAKVVDISEVTFVMFKKMSRPQSLYISNQTIPPIEVERSTPQPSKGCQGPHIEGGIGETKDEIIPPTGIQIWHMPDGATGWYVPTYIIEGWAPGENKNGWYMHESHLKTWIKANGAGGWCILLETMQHWIQQGSRQGLYVNYEILQKSKWSADLKEWHIPPDIFITLITKGAGTNGQNATGDGAEYLEGTYGDTPNDIIPPFGAQKWFMPDGSIGWYIALYLLQGDKSDFDQSGWFVPQERLKTWLQHNGRGGWKMPLKDIQQWLLDGSKDGIYVPGDLLKKHRRDMLLGTWTCTKELCAELTNCVVPSESVVHPPANYTNLDELITIDQILVIPKSDWHLTGSFGKREKIPIQRWTTRSGVTGWLMKPQTLQDLAINDGSEGWYVPDSAMRKWMINEDGETTVSIDDLKEWIEDGSTGGLAVPAESIKGDVVDTDLVKKILENAMKAAPKTLESSQSILLTQADNRKNE